MNMWEILVPTVRPEKMWTAGPKGKYFSTRFHKVWDSKVREITGGITIMQPVKGQWVAPNGFVMHERMIPVRIMATREQIERVVDMTLKYYSQDAVLCYKVSTEVILKYAND